MKGKKKGHGPSIEEKRVKLKRRLNSFYPTKTCSWTPWLANASLNHQTCKPQQWIFCKSKKRRRSIGNLNISCWELRNLQVFLSFLVRPFILHMLVVESRFCILITKFTPPTWLYLKHRNTWKLPDCYISKRVFYALITQWNDCLSQEF